MELHTQHVEGQISGQEAAIITVTRRYLQRRSWYCYRWFWLFAFMQRRVLETMAYSEIKS